MIGPMTRANQLKGVFVIPRNVSVLPDGTASLSFDIVDPFLHEAVFTALLFEEEIPNPFFGGSLD